MGNNVIVLGEPGTTFSDAAYREGAGKYGMPLDRAVYIPVSTNAEILRKAIEYNGYAAIAMATSRQGSVDESVLSFMQLLREFQDTPVSVLAAIQTPIKFCLMARKGISIDTITGVISHPKGLQACANNLRLWGVSREAASNNGRAAWLVRHSATYKTYAALAPLSAAHLNGLHVFETSYEDKFEDGSMAATTFYLIGPKGEKKVPTGKENRALIIFKLSGSDKIGSLDKAVTVIKSQFNQTFIESFVTDQENGHDVYSFALEIEVNEDQLSIFPKVISRFVAFAPQCLVFGPFEFFKT